MILPLIPIKNVVLFPHLAMPIVAGRPSSMAAIDAALAKEDKSILVVAQRDANVENPERENLFSMGTRGVLKRVSRFGSHVELIVQGLERAQVTELTQTKPYLQADMQARAVASDEPEEVEALQREFLQKVAEIEGLLRVVEPSISELVSQFKDPLPQAYLLASFLGLPVEKEQALLEADTVSQALKLMLSYLEHEEHILKLRQRISQKAATEMGKEQREYYLRQQLRAIQQELGEEKPEDAEIGLLRQRFKDADLPDGARSEAEAELNRLSRLPSMAPDYQVIRAHLELILELPWRKATSDNLDLSRAQRILDEDHYDLEKVKERIIEHLAVLKLNPKSKAPILCFVGPPGVGKTSLGQSIARALERKFERMSLGGLHDEAELRGHRRTYIGAMPGRIIQAIRRAGANNPLLMLDEVDKLGADFRGDPSAALMEILDPAQNFSFRDNYLDLAFDLSSVFFITTANTLDAIPAPLLDRMEVLRLSGYTEEEKREIARRYLLPRQSAQAGLTPEQFQVDPAAVLRIIRRYTREAGLRQLERSLGSLARKIALRFAQGQTQSVVVREDAVTGLLGPEHFFSEEARRQLRPGVAAGLAWTEAGGEVLYIEATLLPGREGLTMTGHLGEVMKESVQTALGYAWSHPLEVKPNGRRHAKDGVHIHVPSGAVPKDGPSAGVAITVAVASLYAGLPARSDTAMTGEVTLTGLVLPVGGIKEKVLAAHRAGLCRVILPKANEKDLSELSEQLCKDLQIVLVENMEAALKAALAGLEATVPA